VEDDHVMNAVQSRKAGTANRKSRLQSSSESWRHVDPTGELPQVSPFLVSSQMHSFEAYETDDFSKSCGYNFLSKQCAVVHSMEKESVER